MRSIGRIAGKTASGLTITRCKDIPQVKMAVFDVAGHKLGQVADVIGPVKEPYILIKIKGKTSEGQELFIR